MRTAPHVILLFAVLAFFVSSQGAQAECAEYDLLQLNAAEKAAAGVAKQPTELCYACGGFGEIACGEDEKKDFDAVRTCDSGLEVFPPIKGLKAKVLAGFADYSDAAAEAKGREIPGFARSILSGFAEDTVGKFAERLQFCLKPVPFAKRAKPQPIAAAPDATGDARRTFVMFTGMGGTVLPSTFMGSEGKDPVRRLVSEIYHRVYVIDFNGAGKRDVAGRLFPVRLLEIQADGSAVELARAGKRLDGTNIDIRRVAAHGADLLRTVPVEGRVSVVGYSMGGYFVKDLIYHHYDRLAADGIEIDEVIFTAHPHFAESGVSGADMASIYCTGLASGDVFDGIKLELSGSVAGSAESDGSDVGGRNSAGEGSGGGNAIAQTCHAGLWLEGWSRLMGGGDRRIDGSDYPGIRWISLAGKKNKVGPGPDNFYDREVWTDSRTPTASALGVDDFKRFGGGRLKFDRASQHECGHDYVCLLNQIFDDFPQGPPRPGVPHAIRQGESLWSVAIAAVGPDQADAYWRLLADANGLDIETGARVYLGQTLIMPVIGRVVAEGDTLWAMTDAQEGAWPELHGRHRASLGEDPDLIYPGRMLAE